MRKCAVHVRTIKLHPLHFHTNTIKQQLVTVARSKCVPSIKPEKQPQ